jgi:hypothetical protein
MAVRYCDGAFEIELAAAGQLSDIRRTTEWLRRESLESLTSVRMPMRAAASTDPATAEWQVRPRSEALSAPYRFATVCFGPLAWPIPSALSCGDFSLRSARLAAAERRADSDASCARASASRIAPAVLASSTDAAEHS